MKVYVVTSWDRYDRYTEIEGVYSSKKRAEVEIEKLEKDATYGISFDCGEFEVDEC